MASAIALFGGSFDPVANHHLAIVNRLLDLKMFKEIIIVPCGPRPDKTQINDTDPVYRAVMLNMVFKKMSETVWVDTDDLEQDLFTRTHALEKKYQCRGSIWHVVGSDWVVGGGQGRSKIQQQWAQGRNLWQNSRFVVVKRVGYPLLNRDLPPNSRVVDIEIDGSSSAIRNRCFNHLPIDDWVPAEVGAYINRYGLYRGQLPLKKTSYRMLSPKVLVVADAANSKAVEYQKWLEPYTDVSAPNIIVVLGGDGKLTEAIRRHWHLRLPFFGLNAGNDGYLLNDVPADRFITALQSLTVYHLPLLDVQLTSVSGEKHKIVGFNDAWIERETGQAAWIELTWNGTHRIDKIVGDGILVSTAAGSTGYAKHLCKFSLPTHMNELLLVGMGISKPFGWQDTVFSSNSVFEMKALNKHKRPLRAFVDSVALRTVRHMQVRVSRIASAELAFIEDFDIVAKHTHLQLPYFKATSPLAEPGRQVSEDGRGE
jgi:NAD+ kinase